MSKNKYCESCDQMWPDFKSWYDHDCRKMEALKCPYGHDMLRLRLANADGYEWRCFECVEIALLRALFGNSLVDGS